MTAGGNGGFIGINAPVSASAGGPGIWSIEDATLLTKSNQWPVQETIATGGTISNITSGGVNYRVHTFTSPGTFTITSVGYAVPTSLEYLVVAGGGGGSASYGIYGVYTTAGGGGGAGGLRQSTAPTVLTMVPGSFPVTVGAGGALGSLGNPSVLTWPTGPISCTGGGNGGQPPNGAGQPGGSGGGGGSVGPPPASRTVSAGSGVSGEGFPGGLGGIPNGTGNGGGGGAGGAGIAGGPAPQTTPTRGTGGPGVSSSISNTTVTYAYGGHSQLQGYDPTRKTYGSGGQSAQGPTGTTPDQAGQNGVVIVRYRVL